MITEALALSVLEIVQTVESNIHGLTVEQQLSFSQTVACNLLPQELSSSLHLIHLVEVTKNSNLVASSTLTLTQAAHPRAFNLSVEQLCFIWSDITAEEFWPDVVQTLTLTQSAVGIASKGTASELILTQVVAVAITYGRSVEHELSVQSEVSGYLPSKYWSSYDIEVIAP